MYFCLLENYISMRKLNQLFVFFIIPVLLIAQNEQDSIQKLKEVIIETQRISLPFSENSHSIAVVDSLEIATLSASSVDEILQNLNGIDVRRRGIEGMQSDLYIRGGNFEQVLILIDGIKMDDLQTGHHSMNALISPENIDRIEVIKGAASRIYGQNAMNGAINMVTKKVKTNHVTGILKGGSFGTIGASMSFQKIIEKGSIQFNVNKMQSEGYRYNTDFEYWNAFLKTEINKFELLTTYNERKFGANGFYASPLYTDQYEETQMHLLALKRKFVYHAWEYTAQTYWRRNQDMYLLVRTNPNLYRNMHINNKIGVSLNVNYRSKFGVTGIGLDINKGFLRSNNLGKHQRFSTTVNAEHRFQLFDNKLDITPGIAVTYYDDFGTFAYPGIDVGYRLHPQFKTYINTGYTSRIPTFTNLFYNSASEQGNPDLKPEKALTSEAGIYYTTSRIQMNIAIFHRQATDLIDWSKQNLVDKWKATNFNEILTSGWETSVRYRFVLNGFNQQVKAGYTFMNEEVNSQEVAFSRYELKSFKHQVNVQLQSQFIKNISQNISYNFVERKSGETYHLFNANILTQLHQWKFQMSFNNIFDTIYTETNLVPMPLFHWNGSVTYSF